jgi:hypothetical protein
MIDLPSSNNDTTTAEGNVNANVNVNVNARIAGIIRWGKKSGIAREWQASPGEVIGALERDGEAMS